MGRGASAASPQNRGCHQGCSDVNQGILQLPLLRNGGCSDDDYDSGELVTLPPPPPSPFRPLLYRLIALCICIWASTRQGCPPTSTATTLSSTTGVTSLSRRTSASSPSPQVSKGGLLLGERACRGFGEGFMTAPPPLDLLLEKGLPRRGWPARTSYRPITTSLSSCCLPSLPLLFYEFTINLFNASYQRSVRPQHCSLPRPVMTD